MNQSRLRFLLSLCFGFVVACASTAGDTGQDAVQDLGGSTTGSGTTRTDPGAMKLLIRPLVSGNPIVLGQAYEAGGQKFNINLFRYWLSNVVVLKADGSSYKLPDSYYLMEKTADNTREEVTLSDIPAGDYTGIKFAVGVDVEANSSLDLFAGELTTEVDMDWGWKSGFIFFKIEGDFVVGDKTQAYKMHVGTDSNYKEVQLDFEAPLRIDGAHDTDVAVDANLEKVYESIDLAEHPDTNLQPHSAQIAGGYAGMFNLAASASTAK